MTSEFAPITSPVIVLVGPTAIGKTELSLTMAAEFGCEIISMDSIQVYRYMDIGAAKATLEERQRVRHHLIDIVDPDEQYDAARFVTDALAAIAAICGRGCIPLITGGTGLYLSALLNGLFDEIKGSAEIRDSLRQRLQDEGREALHRELSRIDPESGARIHLNDTQRLLRGLEIFLATGVPWSEHLRGQTRHPLPDRFPHLLQLGLSCERELLYKRIQMRSFNIMQDAFQAEVESLLAMGYGRHLPSMQSIGYRHMGNCIAGVWDNETATEVLVQDTRRYAKRQLTWFRRLANIQWRDIGQADAALADVAQFLHNVR